MTVTDKKKLETDWLKRHTLSDEQRKQLIQSKIDRAREQSRLNRTIGKFSRVE